MRLVVRSLLRALATMLATTFLVFVGIEISIDGGFRAVVLPNGIDPTSARDIAVAEEFHLQEPLPVRYGHWLADLARGDLGRSLRGGLEVSDVLVRRVPISIELTLVATGLALAIALPAGLYTAVRDGRGGGRLVDILLGTAQSLPVFLTPPFLIWLFALRLGWLPAAGWVRLTDSVTGNLRAIAMPVAALTLTEAGVMGRVVRSDAARVLRQDYVVAAVGKGLPTGYVLRRHVLRPASLGLANVIGLNVGALLSGTVVVELIFGIGGLGQELLESAINRDLYLLAGLTVYVVGIYVAIGLLVDLAMPRLDPRLGRP